MFIIYSRFSLWSLLIVCAYFFLGWTVFSLSVMAVWKPSSTPWGMVKNLLVLFCSKRVYYHFVGSGLILYSIIRSALVSTPVKRNRVNTGIKNEGPPDHRQPIYLLLSMVFARSPDNPFYFPSWQADNLPIEIFPHHHSMATYRCLIFPLPLFAFSSGNNRKMGLVW